MVKTAADLVAQANAEVETVSVEQARGLLGRDDVVFVDVREPAEWQNGRIPGAVHTPRGLLEFAADPNSASHRQELSSGKRLVLYCASGARSALAAKTLKDMGIARVSNMLGGFGGWQKGGGEIET
jgi:rhodanese-related sulfurtransferase